MRVIQVTIFLLFSKILLAQNFCNTNEVMNKWFSTHPELKVKFDSIQEEVSKIDKELFKTNYKDNWTLGKTTAASNYTIPVVFHILHLGGTENITDGQIADAMATLNRDFNRLNADTTDIVSPFNFNVGNTKFEFSLATKDPNGNCTNGIIRHYDTRANWTGSFSEYAYTWNPTRYLNVYVVKSISNGSAGYTYLPGSGVPTAADVIVILNSYIGSIGTGNLVNSRALTHEVGHWFSLLHVWGLGNQPGIACGDDGVADTPITKGFSGCSLNNANICNPGIVENVQNYMDYAYCSRMFTTGQSARMTISINSLQNGRNNLSTAQNLSVTGITHPGTFCLPMVSITSSPSTKACSGKLISVFSYSYNTNPNTYLWFVNNNATILSPSSPNTGIIFTNPGTYTVSCLVANGNGSSTQTLEIEVVDGNTQINSLNRESFENPHLQLPLGWSVINATTPNETWEVNNWSASKGVYSMLIAGEVMPPNTIEILESPSYDFKNNFGAHLTFKYAYAKSKINNTDLFKVQVSKDCGGSWDDLFVPDMTTLAVSSGGIDANLFFPTASQWVLKDLTDTDNTNISSFQNESNVRFRFYFKEDVAGYANRFYLDEVNFNEPVGVNELTRDIKFSLYPNPAKSDFTLDFSLSNKTTIRYSINSALGSVIFNSELQNFIPGEHKILLNETKGLEPGIYFVNFKFNGVEAQRKLVIER